MGKVLFLEPTELGLNPDSPFILYLWHGHSTSQISDFISVKRGKDSVSQSWLEN